MSARSWLSQQWKPVALGAVFGAVEAFAINKVSIDNPRWWWWAVLVAALSGIIACGLWGLRRGAAGPDGEVAEMESAVSQRDNSVTQQNVKGSSQHLSGEGSTISISADNNSIAAYKIRNLKWGGGSSHTTDDGNP